MIEIPEYITNCLRLYGNAVMPDSLLKKYETRKLEQTISRLVRKRCKISERIFCTIVEID